MKSFSLIATLLFVRVLKDSIFVKQHDEIRDCTYSRDARKERTADPAAD